MWPYARDLQDMIRGKLGIQSEPSPAVIDILPLRRPGSLCSLTYLAFHSKSTAKVTFQHPTTHHTVQPSQLQCSSTMENTRIGVNMCFACTRGEVIYLLPSHLNNGVPAVIMADCRVAATLSLSNRIQRSGVWVEGRQAGCHLHKTEEKHGFSPSPSDCLSNPHTH